MRRLWIDDLRPAPLGWVHVLSSDEAIYMLTYWKDHDIEISDISYDHDLGGEDTSRKVILWQCENDFWPRRVQIHSANPVGVDWMRAMVVRYAPQDVPVSVIRYQGG